MVLFLKKNGFAEDIIINTEELKNGFYKNEIFINGKSIKKVITKDLNSRKYIVLGLFLGLEYGRSKNDKRRIDRKIF
jgi:hypothetical protein